MNNITAEESINTCLYELEKIKMLIEGMGSTSNPVPFLTKYAIIKSCGTIEFCFKAIISDIHLNQSQQIANYINTTFRFSSINPSIGNICRSLMKFDKTWNESFKLKFKEHPHSNRIGDSLRSLNNSRNNFAHGGHPTTTFDNVIVYFNDSVEVIKILDEVVR
jgi:hypothetical protein